MCTPKNAALEKINRALSVGATALMALGLCASAEAGDIVVEATGTVLQANPSGNSPFQGISVGDTVVVHYEVFVPGMDIVPGQLTDYTIDGAASYVEINQIRDANPSVTSNFTDAIEVVLQ